MSCGIHLAHRFQLLGGLQPRAHCGLRGGNNHNLSRPVVGLHDYINHRERLVLVPRSLLRDDDDGGATVGSLLFNAACFTAGYYLANLFIAAWAAGPARSNLTGFLAAACSNLTGFLAAAWRRLHFLKPDPAADDDPGRYNGPDPAAADDLARHRPSSWELIF
jgi:hypothetical protein